MTTRVRRPGASLLLAGVAVLVVIALESRGADDTPTAAGSAATEVGDATGEEALGDGVPGTVSDAGLLEGDAAVGDDGGPGASGSSGERSRVVRDGWTVTAIDAWERRGAPVPMARVGDLELLVPVFGPVVLGFHEASTTSAREMHPLGPPNGNDNTTRFTPPFHVRLEAEPYVVLASRGRTAGPTTAVDVVARPRARVVAPIDGEVTDVRSYALYGRYPDQRLEIRSSVDPSVRVVMVHVTGVTVAVGDRVVAGSTIVAERATAFPFASQVDRETEPDRFPHVHLEVQAFDARRPGDETA